MQLNFHGKIPGDQSRKPTRSGRKSFRQLVTIHPVLSILIAGIVLAYAFDHIGPVYSIQGERQPGRELGQVVDSTASLTSVIGRTPVVLLVDVSGSMDDEEDQQRLQKYRQELESKKLLRGEVDIDGAGIMNSSGVRNLVYGIERAFTEFPGLRALYVLSDFDTAYVPYWATDVAEQKRLKKVLTHEKIPLYLGTVRFLPGQLHRNLARETGGGIIFHQ